MSEENTLESLSTRIKNSPYSYMGVGPEKLFRRKGDDQNIWRISAIAPLLNADFEKLDRQIREEVSLKYSLSIEEIDSNPKAHDTWSLEFWERGIDLFTIYTLETLQGTRRIACSKNRFEQEFKLIAETEIVSFKYSTISEDGVIF